MGKNGQYFRRTATVIGIMLFAMVSILFVRDNLATEAGFEKRGEQHKASDQSDALLETSDQAVPERPGYMSGRVLVKFSTGVPDERKLALLEKIGARSVKVFSIPVGLELIEIPDEIGVQQAREYFSRQPEVEYSEPDFTDKTPEQSS